MRTVRLILAMGRACDDCREGETSGWKQKIIHEMNEYWLNFVFLAVVFSVMTLYRRLLMAEYHIAYLHYGFAVI